MESHLGVNDFIECRRGCMHTSTSLSMCLGRGELEKSPFSIDHYISFA